jgi:hypothetical protein
MPVYQDFQPDCQPGFLQGGKSRAWGAGVGYQKDVLVEVGIQGIQQASVSALAYHGAERGLPRYDGDTDASYADRLKQAWVLWEYAGTAEGIRRQLEFAGFNHVQIYETWSWGSLFPSSEWWHFWVLIDDTIDHIFGDISFRWGTTGFQWGDGTHWGFTKVPPNLGWVRKIVNTWKPAHTICESIIVQLQGWRYGIDFWWGDGQKWGGTSATI